MNQTEIDNLNLQLFENSCDDVVKIAEGQRITGRGETKKKSVFFISTGACYKKENCNFLHICRKYKLKKCKAITCIFDHVDLFPMLACAIAVGNVLIFHLCAYVG